MAAARHAHRRACCAPKRIRCVPKAGPARKAQERYRAFSHGSDAARADSRDPDSPGLGRADPGRGVGQEHGPDQVRPPCRLSPAAQAPMDRWTGIACLPPG
jgi:hypothetical protein